MNALFVVVTTVHERTVLERLTAQHMKMSVERVTLIAPMTVCKTVLVHGVVI